MKKRVIVLFGGNSNEREISVITGMLAVNLLKEACDIVPVYLLTTGGMATGKFRGPADFKRDAKVKLLPVCFTEGGLLVKRKKLRVDCALNCCHGGMGEDGTLAALLRFYRIPSASPDTPMSAVYMDKILTKVVARGLGIPTAEGVFVREEDFGQAEKCAEELGYPVIVKPARLGSSIGVKVARNGEELKQALQLAFRLDRAALVEQYLPGKRDINCAACRMGGATRLSPLEEVFSGEDILTFSEKYEAGRGSKVPADLPEETAEAIRTYTRQLYELFGGRGVVRADYLMVDGKVYFNELNTVPGSLACYLFGNGLTVCRDFLLSLLEEATLPAEKETVVSGILDGAVFSGRKGVKKR